VADPINRRLPRLAYVPLAILAIYCLFGTFALVHDRGDDFRRFYASADAWAHGGDPYGVVIADTPNLNHPLLLPLLWLFTLGSAQAGFVAWTLVSLALLAACIPTISRHARIVPLDLGILTLALTGTFVALAFGQVSFLLMAAFTAAWSADRRGRPISAALWLGLLSVLKPFYGLFGLYFVWRRQFGALVAYAVTFATGTLAGWALIGPSGFVEWLTRLQDVRWRWHIYNASVWGVGDRLFTVQPFFRATGWTPLADSTAAARVVTIALLVVVGVVIIRAASRVDVDRTYALLGLGCLLISPLGWLYYLPAFLGPVIVVLARRPSFWLWPIGAIAVCPYTLLVSRVYGKLGTVIVGQWAFAIVAGLLVLVASASNVDSHRLPG
jgi:hypothetical protein